MDHSTDLKQFLDDVVSDVRKGEEALEKKASSSRLAASLKTKSDVGDALLVLASQVEGAKASLFKVAEVLGIDGSEFEDFDKEAVEGHVEYEVEGVQYELNSVPYSLYKFSQKSEDHTSKDSALALKVASAAVGIETLNRLIEKQSGLISGGASLAGGALGIGKHYGGRAINALVGGAGKVTQGISNTVQGARKSFKDSLVGADVHGLKGARAQVNKSFGDKPFGSATLGKALHKPDAPITKRTLKPAKEKPVTGINAIQAGSLANQKKDKK